MIRQVRHGIAFLFALATVLGGAVGVGDSSAEAPTGHGGADGSGIVEDVGELAPTVIPPAEAVARASAFFQELGLRVSGEPLADLRESDIGLRSEWVIFWPEGSASLDARTGHLVALLVVEIGAGAAGDRDPAGPASAEPDFAGLARQFARSAGVQPPARPPSVLSLGSDGAPAGGEEALLRQVVWRRESHGVPCYDSVICVVLGAESGSVVGFQLGYDPPSAAPELPPPVSKEEALQAAKEQAADDAGWARAVPRLMFANLQMQTSDDMAGQPALCWVIERREEGGALVETLFVEAASGEVHRTL